MKQLIVGSNDTSTSTLFNKFNLKESVLVASVDQEYTVGHTALQEFSSVDDFLTVLAQADEVYWGHPRIAEFINQEEYYNLLYLLRGHQEVYQNIVNFDTIKLDPYNWNLKLPELNANDAVFLGCSYTAGVGVPDVSQQYSSIVAKAFDANCVNLSRGGGSNNRSFDIFSQLNFKPRQIVVWQITFLERLRYCEENGALTDLMFATNRKSNNRALTEVYNRKFLLYELLVKIRATIKIARANDLRFVFWLADYKNQDIFSIDDQMYFYNYPEFIPPTKMQDFLVDSGTDNLHPGPGSNKIIADVIIEHINQVYK